jgi:LmbE family N-acetylglucosaminyl deacetylase
LGFPDSSCRGYSESSEAPLLINDDILGKDSVLSKVHTAIAEVLRRSRFDLVFAPLAFGNHVDHYSVFKAVNDTNLNGAQKVYYEDLPYCALLGMNEIDHMVSQRLQGAYPINVNITKEIAQKIDNMRMYNSQVDAHDIDAVRSHSRRIIGSEHSFHERIWIQVHGR